MLKSHKKGAIESSELISWILILGGFVVIIVFIFFKLDLGSQTKEDLCKLSVLTRATSPQEASAYVPLKCTTKKICLAENGKCADYNGEDNLENIKLTKDNEAKQQIEKTLAESMYNCWNMMGEGKLDLFNGGLAKSLSLQAQNVSCVICSRVKIENSNLDKLNVNVEEYMRTTQIEGRSETYLQYFANDRSVNSYVSPKINENENKITFSNNPVNEYAVVFSQIKPENYENAVEKLATFAGVAGVGAVQVPFIGKALISPVGLTIAGLTGLGVAGFSMSKVYEGKAAAAVYCGQFQSETESKNNGCSAVQILPYEVNTINKICAAIEGAP